MNVRYNVQNADELSALKEIMEYDLSNPDRMVDNSSYSFLDFFTNSGFSQDEIEIKLKDDIVMVACSFNLYKGLKVTSLVPIIGVEIKESLVHIMLDINFLANSANANMMVLQVYMEA